MYPAETGPRRRGAMRSEAARTAVLDATAALFAERGYDQLTIEGIASRAGVAKQTIYRWWPSKSAVVAETLLEGRLIPGRFDLPDTGDVRADLAAWLQDLFAFVDDNNALVRSLVAAAAENATVGEQLNDALGATSGVTERIERAVAAGHLRPTTPVEMLVEALVGAVVVRALRRAPGGVDTDGLVDALLGI